MRALRESACFFFVEFASWLQEKTVADSVCELEEKYIKSIMLQRDIRAEDDSEIDGHRISAAGT
eukprot:4500086-Amphidinium_carterae.1